MARAMWKASLVLGSAAIPVKLYAAAEDRDVRFRLLHARDRAPVTQKMVDPRTEEEVPDDEIVRGVEVERGLFVRMEEDDLAAGAPKPSREIELLRFVPPSAIDPAWFERPYTLGPDGAGEPYAALRDAVRASGRLGVARWAMRGRRYFGALEATGDHLVLVSLRGADEVMPAARVPAPEGRDAGAAELRLAEQLLGALEGEFDPGELRDEYRERLLAYLAARAKGRRVRLPAETAPKPSADLARALERSLAAVKGGKKRRAA